jgi:hypothetical protein
MRRCNPPRHVYGALQANADHLGPESNET